MSREYFMFYIEASVFSILTFLLFLHHDLTTATRSERQMEFDRTLVAFMLYFFSDALWAGVISGVIPRTVLSVALPNLANCLLLSLISYQWLRFIAVSVNMPSRNLRRVQVLMRLPLEITGVVMVLSWAVAPGFWVSPEGELNGLYNVLLVAAPVLYLFFSFFYSVARAARQRSAAIRRRYILIGLFPMMVLAFGVLQLLMLDAPLFCLGCALLMLFFFLQEAKEQISIDPLTGLNNRGQLERYAAQEVGRRDGATVYVLMMDANDFKRINDTYGHAEGDRALLLIAETLKEVAAALAPPPFIGRYGGDEFVLVVYAEEEAAIQALIGRIRAGLRERCERHALAYPLTVSIGYAAMLTGRDTFQWCLEQADERLYLEKKRTKQGR